MYEKVCSKKGWKIDLINISRSDAGGYKEIIFSVNGQNIYSYLKYESGVHRVQEEYPKLKPKVEFTLQQLHLVLPEGGRGRYKD